MGNQCCGTSQADAPNSSSGPRRAATSTIHQHKARSGSADPTLTSPPESQGHDATVDVTLMEPLQSYFGAPLSTICQYEAAKLRLRPPRESRRFLTMASSPSPHSRYGAGNDGGDGSGGSHSPDVTHNTHHEVPLLVASLCSLMASLQWVNGPLETKRSVAWVERVRPILDRLLQSGLHVSSAPPSSDNNPVLDVLERQHPPPQHVLSCTHLLTVFTEQLPSPLLPTVTINALEAALHAAADRTPRASDADFVERVWAQMQETHPCEIATLAALGDAFRLAAANVVARPQVISVPQSRSDLAQPAELGLLLDASMALLQVASRAACRRCERESDGGSGAAQRGCRLVLQHVLQRHFGPHLCALYESRWDAAGFEVEAQDSGGSSTQVPVIPSNPSTEESRAMTRAVAGASGGQPTKRGEGRLAVSTTDSRPSTPPATDTSGGSEPHSGAGVPARIGAARADGSRPSSRRPSSDGQRLDDVPKGGPMSLAVSHIDQANVNFSNASVDGEADTTTAAATDSESRLRLYDAALQPSALHASNSTSLEVFGSGDGDGPRAAPRPSHRLRDLKSQFCVGVDGVVMQPGLPSAAISDYTTTTVLDGDVVGHADPSSTVFGSPSHATQNYQGGPLSREAGSGRDGGDAARLRDKTTLLILQNFMRDSADVSASLRREVEELRRMVQRQSALVEDGLNHRAFRAQTQQVLSEVSQSVADTNAELIALRGELRRVEEASKHNVIDRDRLAADAAAARFSAQEVLLKWSETERALLHHDQAVKFLDQKAAQLEADQRRLEKLEKSLRLDVDTVQRRLLTSI